MTFIDVSHFKPYCKPEDLKASIDSWIHQSSVPPSSRFLACSYSTLKVLSGAYKGSGLNFGSSEMLSVKEGCFTAPIAAEMLKEAEARFVLIGTFEERRNAKDVNLEIPNKIKKALENGLSPFLCVGETYSELKEGKSEEVLTAQLKSAFEDLKPEILSQLTLIYEAPWSDSFTFKPALEELKTGYLVFVSALKAALGESTFSSKIIFALPEEFKELPSEIKDLAGGIYRSHPITYSKIGH